jgi:stage II sporulation protein D
MRRPDRPEAWLAAVALALGVLWLGARALGPGSDPWAEPEERSAASDASASEHLSVVAAAASLHGAPAAALEPPVQVRLMRFEGAQDLRLEVTGAWRVLDEQGAILQQGHGIKGRLRLDAAGILIGSFLFNRDRLVLAPAGDDALLLEDERFSGALEIGLMREAGAATGLRVVLHLPLEQYVLGVVCGELATNARDAQQAARAQAVAARTWALWKLDSRKGALRDTADDQVFRGTDWHTDAARQAVADTRGLVLTWNDDLLPAFFHADCAGHTADARALGFVKGDCPPLAGVADLDCRAGTRPWKVTVSAERLDTLAVSMGLGTWMRSLHALDRDPAGRMLRTRFLGADRHYDGTAEELRLRLRVPSTVWTFVRVREDGALSVEGYGNGHGVGLCQTGALRRARAGADWRAILAAYYPGARVRSLTGDLME